MRRVRQVHEDGCFVACVATLLGLKYDDALKVVRPDVVNKAEVAVFGDVGMAVNASLKRMRCLGFRLRKTRLRSLKRMRDRHLEGGNPHLVIIRWDLEPRLAHAIVVGNKVLDPCMQQPHPDWFYEEQVHLAYEVTAMPVIALT